MTNHVNQREAEPGGRRPSNTNDVDDLRRQLRALGYLEAGVDRFLLAPTQDTRRPAALAFLSSVRVGILGGLLLGPAAAIGVGGRVPGLVSGVRDAFVIALYLAIVFFVALAATAFLASLGARMVVRPSGGRFARRARVITNTIGGVIALACLTYLTFWWRNANAGFGWSAPLWTTFALAVAVGISLLIGHAIRTTAVAVLATARPAAELPPVPSKSWRVIVVGGTLALAGAATVLGLTAAPDLTAPNSPPLTIVGGGQRVRVIAIDGVDRRMVAEAHWVDEQATMGARFRLEPQDTFDPARAWTTIATGEPPSVHGVRGLETRRVAGLRGTFTNTSTVGRSIAAATDLVRLTRPSIASGEERQSMTIWEVAERAGLRTAVVNWWATWPATARDATVISDRAVLRLEQGGKLDAEISPASLYPVLQSRWAAIRKRAAEAANKAFSTVADPSTVATLRRSAGLDATIIGLVDALPPPDRDLDVVYLPGLDIAQHALFASDRAGALLPSRAAERVAALKTYYGFLGEALGAWLRPGQGEVVILVTEPGRVESPAEGTMTVYRARTGDLKPGIEDRGVARVDDLAPTILNALGVPLSRELPGRPRGPFAPPPTYVATYGRPFTPPPPRSGKPLDQEMIDRLRSLGYVK